MLTKTQLVRNRTLARSLNDRVLKIAGTVETFGALVFTCECGIYACTERVPMTVAEYAGIRLQQNQFLVCPDHNIEPTNSVTADCDGYTVVDLSDSPDEANASDTSALLASLRA